MTEQELRDTMRQKLSDMENEVLKTIASLADSATSDPAARWLSIGKTHIEQGFMAVKRGLYEGKRVGDA